MRNRRIRLPYIERWSLVSYPHYGSQWAFEIKPGVILSGFVYNRAGFPDGVHIYSSSVEKIWKKNGRLYAQTRNTRYRLLEPDPAYRRYILSLDDDKQLSFPFMFKENV